MICTEREWLCGHDKTRRAVLEALLLMTDASYWACLHALELCARRRLEDIKIREVLVAYLVARGSFCFRQEHRSWKSCGLDGLLRVVIRREAVSPVADTVAVASKEHLARDAFYLERDVNDDVRIRRDRRAAPDFLWVVGTPWHFEFVFRDENAPLQSVHDEAAALFHVRKNRDDEDRKEDQHEPKVCVFLEPEHQDIIAYFWLP